MLHRREGESLVLISQPAHAWISGQLAAAWGGPDAEAGFQPVSTTVRLAAEQHDIGWLDWETQPTLNDDTGLPHTFSQLPTLAHLDVWSMSTPRALAYGLLPAMLISMHGTYLYERFHDFDADSDEEERAARAFLERETVFQQRAFEHVEQLHALDMEEIQRMRRLVSTWDAMSLAICMGAAEGRTIGGVPAGDRDTDIRLTPQDDALRSYSVTPWPFGFDTVNLTCEARLLAGTFEHVEVMREALRAAPPTRLDFTLFPG